MYVELLGNYVDLSDDLDNLSSDTKLKTVTVKMPKICHPFSNIMFLTRHNDQTKAWSKGKGFVKTVYLSGDHVDLLDNYVFISDYGVDLPDTMSANDYSISE